MAEEKKPSLRARVADSKTYRAVKATAAFVADNVIYGKAAQQGAAEAANALFAGTAYVPYGSAQQPEDLGRDNSPTVHGAVVPDSKPEAGVTAATPTDAMPIVNIPPELPATDPLQRAAERARSAARSRSTSREPEIG